ncbi:forkhead box protein E1-like isoform X3 [Centruroides sculpturatus]|uniref:forkhead box protein E1-like isoform X3 n=1 Tax=Centruroides sculpturatus TaxID=218467 RepID=UPI000C6E19D6|nr:forkhead box protein E1-like isoform X3 [Centruroides sculpturatus]XP_023224575.1 forkhead box protein E1-like isoform X3 [Centruroides sculpturatus]
MMERYQANDKESVSTNIERNLLPVYKVYEEAKRLNSPNSSSDRDTLSPEKNIELGDQDPNTKPPYSYAALITMAIKSSPEKKLTLNEIYQYFTKEFAFFRNNRNKNSWKNSIRHNLSLYQCFKRIPPNGKGSKKGGFWIIDPEAEDMYEDNNYLRRRIRRKPNLSQATLTTYFPDAYNPISLNHGTCFASNYSNSAVSPNWSLSHVQSIGYASCQRITAGQAALYSPYGHTQPQCDAGTQSLQLSAMNGYASHSFNNGTTIGSFHGHFASYRNPPSTEGIHQVHYYPWHEKQISLDDDLKKSLFYHKIEDCFIKEQCEANRIFYV